LNNSSFHNRLEEVAFSGQPLLFKYPSNHNPMKNKDLVHAIILFVIFTCLQCTTKTTTSDPEIFVGDIEHLLISPPDHGYVSNLSASRWEEAMITGNGTFGALVMGYPLKERIILSHEKLFMPENPPTNAPDLGGSLDIFRKLVLSGEGDKASDLSLKLGEEVGIDGMIWTDPLIPACQMEIEGLDNEPLLNYSRSVNYETGEATTAWTTKNGRFNRTVFASRLDGIIATRFSSQNGTPSNFRIRLSQLPVNEDESNDEEQDFDIGDLIENVTSTVKEEGILKYTIRFMKKWEGSLKGYTVETQVASCDGTMRSDGEWLYLEGCSDVLLLSGISLSYEMPVSTETVIGYLPEMDYNELLLRHANIHGEMFNRFSLSLGGDDDLYQTPDQLIQSSSNGNLNNKLVEELCKAARYILISSTGEIPPTLQGIWGGTWRPAWSGDFTQNGNVPSAIASGLNTNFQEVTEAHLDYMWSMMDDFRDNARDLYGAPGVFVPSRSSSSGKTYHYGEWHPHLFWFAGGAWTAHFFYDYWQYTGDKQFLEERAIPFMLAAAEFLEFILTKEEDGTLMFLPSYSPEVGPLGNHPLSINATMDIAALKQLLRNLLRLVDQGFLKTGKTSKWNQILENLPAYAIDETGDLKEWIWPGLKNDNSHRHASHLYPLFYEVDPDFEANPELKEAAVTAIEKRLEYRRGKNGAEMAFGLVQKGLAAAHIKDVSHAYECVDWLCNSYWSPAFTSYHDPGEIFNVDICGGLPALLTEMIIQSSSEEITLLPALPEQWPEGEVEGVRTRCGITVDLTWEEDKPVGNGTYSGPGTKLDYELTFKISTSYEIFTQKGSHLWIRSSICTLYFLLLPERSRKRPGKT